MSITAVNSRTFRDHLATYFNMASRGEHVIVKHGRKCAYAIVAVDMDRAQEQFAAGGDLIKVERAVAHAARGEDFRFDQLQKLERYLDTLAEE